MYADDSAIFYAHKSPQVISDKLSQTLDNCAEWLIDNKLSLHLGKTESILFGPKQKLKHVDFSIKDILLTHLKRSNIWVCISTNF